MKSLLRIIGILALTGCSHFQHPSKMYTTVTYGEHTSLAHQCNIPVSYAVSSRVPPNARSAAHAAANYWNSVYGSQLFYNMGDLDWTLETPGSFALVLIDITDTESDKTIARTHYAKFPSFYGCISANIELYKSGIKGLSPASLETVIRHELGHTLGLSHSSVFFDTGLMGPSLPGGLEEPIDLADVEQEAFKIMYPYNPSKIDE